MLHHRWFRHFFKLEYVPSQQKSREVFPAPPTSNGRPRLSILGMARPDAPPELGLALSQARAVRVRSHLLGLLANCPAWEDEHAIDGGVRHLWQLQIFFGQIPFFLLVFGVPYIYIYVCVFTYRHIVIVYFDALYFVADRLHRTNAVLELRCRWLWRGRRNWRCACFLQLPALGWGTHPSHWPMGTTFTWCLLVVLQHWAVC